jgi:ATP-dependent Clp protease ATP-binding subunit ClpX
MNRQIKCKCTHCFDEVDLSEGAGLVVDMARMTIILCWECAAHVFLEIGRGLGQADEIEKYRKAGLDKEQALDKLRREHLAEELDDMFKDVATEEERMDKFLEENNITIEDDESAEILNPHERYTPQHICKLLDRDIIGHTAAKHTLALAAHNHLLRNYCHEAAAAGELDWLADEDPELVDVVPEKSNILLVGPTGSGKTLLARKLAEILELPMISVSATRFTERGYVGDTFKSVFEELYYAADCTVERAQYGIVYLDEFDKLARRDTRHSRDISGLGVQQELLRLIEGDQVLFKVPDEKLRVSLKTENVLFICGGSFANLLESLVPRKTIGFANDDSQRSVHLMPRHLVDFGFLPELVGRLPVIIQLDELTEDDLYRVLTEPRNALVKQYRKLALVGGRDFALGEEELRKIARRAVELGTGARALRALVEEAARG